MILVARGLGRENRLGPPGTQGRAGSYHGGGISGPFWRDRGGLVLIQTRGPGEVTLTWPNRDPAGWTSSTHEWPRGREGLTSKPGWALSAPSFSGIGQKLLQVLPGQEAGSLAAGRNEALLIERAGRRARHGEQWRSAPLTGVEWIEGRWRRIAQGLRGCSMLKSSREGRFISTLLPRNKNLDR
ncbi:hypothetical protein HPP92_026262 [Vanilla planifolia]|uniref:Uncharacterized protein n=1 Tax=Vanilla planifolia TaxID=51239 RepID=A0A835PFT3_VANPL|nr:hypothetical protein HPP92_026262 [Vanilla planifolia]